MRNAAADDAVIRPIVVVPIYRVRAVFVYLHVFVLVGAGIDFMQVRRLDASGTDRRRGDGAEDKRG